MLCSLPLSLVSFGNALSLGWVIGCMDEWTITGMEYSFISMLQLYMYICLDDLMANLFLQEQWKWWNISSGTVFNAYNLFPNAGGGGGHLYLLKHFGIYRFISVTWEKKNKTKQNNGRYKQLCLTCILPWLIKLLYLCHNS